jgi:glycerophosphoryl diester phosphodiesterase
MAYAPIAFIAPNYRDYKNYWLKAYEPSTTSTKAMSSDIAGTAIFSKLQLNKDGFFVSAGGALIIPHIDGAYDLYLFPNESDADSNNTANAIRLADNIEPSAGGGSGGDSFDEIKESKTISSGVSTVVFSNVDCEASVFYVLSSNNVRGYLFEGEDYNVTDVTTIELISTFDDGTVIEAVQRQQTSLLTTTNVDLTTPKFNLIAHRGFRNSFPQNTMLAFTSAIKSGATSLECDVQISLDGDPIVFHDTTVDALTDGAGTVSVLTTSYLQGLTFDETASTIYSAVKMPLFSDVLDYCKSAGVILYPEIKGYRTQADIALMINAINAAKMQEQVVVQSFIQSDLDYVRSINKTIRVGLLGSSSTPSVYTQAIEDMRDLGRAYIFWNYAAVLTTPDILTVANANKVPVAVWTVNDSTDAKALMKLGVNDIMSDINLEVV